MGSLYLPKFNWKVNVLKKTKLEKNYQLASRIKPEFKVKKNQIVKKYYLNLLSIIFCFLFVKLAIGNTFPNCGKLDQAIKFNGGILYIKSHLLEEDLKVEDLSRLAGPYMPDSWSSDDDKKCVAAYTDGNNEKTYGVFAYTKDSFLDSRPVYFLPGYQPDRSIIASRGNYKNNYKDGYWEYYFTEENNGQQKGQFKSIGHFKNGKKEGIWLEFQHNGHGHFPIFLSPLIIQYVDGQRHGPFLNGFTSEYEFADYGEFKNDKKHGFWEKECNFSGGGTCLCAPDRISFRKSYKEGRLDGPQWIWDEIQDRRSKGRMKNGLKHGRWIYAIRPPICGTLKDLITNGGFSMYHSDGRYEDGLKTGLWKTVHWNGKDLATGHYFKGKKQGLWTYTHISGELASKIIYIDDIPEDGDWVLTAPNEISKGTIKKGKKEGVWTYYHGLETMNLKPHYLPQDPKKFQLILTQIWKDGKLISEEKE